MTESGRNPTLQRILEAVKRRSDGAVVLSGVGIVALAAALATPRGTEPRALPLPTPNRARLYELATVDRERAADAHRQALSFAVRSVGEMLRRSGASSVQPSGNAPALDDLRVLARRALASEGERGLLALRAVQSELFVQAARDWAASGTARVDFRELGGDFVELATTSGWRTGSKLVLTDDELALLFRMRWNELTGLSETPSFALTLDELRARYALLLRHPSGPDAATRLRRQFGYVAAIEKLDHDYPAQFARGVLFYRAADYESALAAFQAHLAAHPNGPWTLRAQNHLLQALARLDER